MMVAGSVMTGYLLVGGVALAAGPGMMGERGGVGGRAPGLVGTVSAINGTTITVTNKGWGANATATTYAVDASTATVSKNGATSSLSNVVVGDTVMIVGKVSGTNVAATAINDGVLGRGMMGDKAGRGVMGTVASVSGNTITVTQKAGPQSTTSTTYTVDATNAKIDKSGATGTISSIAVGDTVMVEGTVTGTNVVATTIHDGVPQGIGMGGQHGMQNAAPVIQGNGQPVVAGSITAINGSVLTITNKSNITYTVDTTNAKIAVKNVLSTISGLTVGDSVIVQGAVNGTSIAASSVTDNGTMHAVATSTANTVGGAPKAHGGFMGGFFGGIGDFFHGLFGF